jgi:hypothetical protein
LFGQIPQDVSHPQRRAWITAQLAPGYFRKKVSQLVGFMMVLQHG